MVFVRFKYRNLVHHKFWGRFAFGHGAFHLLYCGRIRHRNLPKSQVLLRNVATASSLTSVAAEPAIVAFSLKADSGSAGKIAAAPSFLIHMLDAENVQLAKNFDTHG